MKVRYLAIASCIGVTILMGAPPAMAANHECVAGKSTAASYTWNFKAEANNIFQDIQFDAQQARYHADRLQTFARDGDMTWDSHADQLDELKTEVNDMGAKLCRLETIRRVVAPWQQKEIDRIASTLRLMADSTQDAINFGNTHQRDLWLASYRTYANNIFADAQSLANSVDHAVEYARTSREYHELGHEMGSPSD